MKNTNPGCHQDIIIMMLRCIESLLSDFRTFDNHENIIVLSMLQMSDIKHFEDLTQSENDVIKTLSKRILETYFDDDDEEFE